jgi:hypothetical protein
MCEFIIQSKNHLIDGDNYSDNNSDSETYSVYDFYDYDEFSPDGVVSVYTYKGIADNCPRRYWDIRFSH